VSRTRILLIVAPAAVLLAACGSASTSASSPATAPPAVAATAAATPSPAASPAASPSALAGTWSGTYSGAYSGTFTLTWQQSGSALSGTIMISSFGDSLAIHGRVDGSSIKFGTVGSSTRVTYSGSVSGTSMSGNWQIATPSGTPGGTWSATKS